MTTVARTDEQLKVLEEITCPDTRAAVLQVAQDWRDDRGDAVNVDEVITVLQCIGRRLELPETVHAVDIEPARSVLGRRLLQLIRSAMIRAWANDPLAAADGRVIRVLKRIESLQQAIEPDWSEHFSARLSGPDSLELVVQIAHDIRSPLTSILFLADTIQRGHSGTISELQHRQLGLVYSAALGLSSVASDVLELARGGDKLVEETPTPFSIRETFDSIRDIVRPIAEEKGLEIKLFPPVSDQRLGHPLALSRVLLNLTTNALKFTDTGFVTLEAIPKGMYRLRFAVRDTGSGINPETMDSLYQPFRRAKGRTGYAFSGTGLGLAISRKLVEAMGGSLVFESEPGGGTEFHFELDSAIPGA